MTTSERRAWRRNVSSGHVCHPRCSSISINEMKIEIHGGGLAPRRTSRAIVNRTAPLCGIRPITTRYKSKFPLHIRDLSRKFAHHPPNDSTRTTEGNFVAVQLKKKKKNARQRRDIFVSSLSIFIAGRLRRDVDRDDSLLNRDTSVERFERRREQNSIDDRNAKRPMRESAKIRRETVDGINFTQRIQPIPPPRGEHNAREKCAR